MLEIICESCSGEMPISCPMAIAPIEILDQRSSGFVIPRVSPGSSIPVCCPNPKERMYLYMRSSPMRRAILIAPTSLDQIEWLCHSAGFSGKLDSGLLPESEGADVFVHALIAHAQGNFDRAHVTRSDRVALSFRGFLREARFRFAARIRRSGCICTCAHRPCAGQF